MKREIAPLVSTIVLLVFSIGLGAVVIGWGSAEVKVAVAEKGCDRIGITIIDINAVPELCYQDSILRYTAQNNGEIDIDAVEIAVIGDASVANTITKGIPVGDVIRNEVEIGQVGKIGKVIFTPKIKVGDSERVCAKDGYSLENIRKCD